MSEVSKEYGEALFALLEEDKLTDSLHDDVTCIRNLFHSNQPYASLLTSPKIGKAEKKNMIISAFKSAHPYLLHFLEMMVERGYAKEIEASFEEFETLFRNSRGISLADVYSPIPLSKKQKEELQKALQGKFQKTIQIQEHIDSSLVGGIRVIVDGTLLDGSIRSRLNGMKKTLSETVL